MTRTLLYLRTKPSRRDEVLQAFERFGVLTAASRQAGFLGAEVQVPLDNENDVVVTTLWASPEHYDAWLGNPARVQVLDELRPLLAGEPESHVYRVVESIS